MFARDVHILDMTRVVVRSVAQAHREPFVSCVKCLMRVGYTLDEAQAQAVAVSIGGVST